MIYSRGCSSAVFAKLDHSFFNFLNYLPLPQGSLTGMRVTSIKFSPGPKKQLNELIKSSKLSLLNCQLQLLYFPTSQNS